MTTVIQTNLATTKTKDADKKILVDLDKVKEKMDLCKTMLNPAAGAGNPTFSLQDESMMTVVGFLEACAPRMVELVELAAMGAVSEEVLMECLSVNDQLQKQLAEIEQAAMAETKVSSTAAASAPSLTAQFDDLLLGDTSNSVPVTADDSKFTIDDEDDNDDAKPPAIEKASSDDDFDAFFAERTGN